MKKPYILILPIIFAGCQEGSNSNNEKTFTPINTNTKFNKIEEKFMDTLIENERRKEYSSEINNEELEIIVDNAEKQVINEDSNEVYGTTDSDNTIVASESQEIISKEPNIKENRTIMKKIVNKIIKQKHANKPKKKKIVSPYFEKLDTWFQPNKKHNLNNNPASKDKKIGEELEKKIAELYELLLLEKDICEKLFVCDEKETNFRKKRFLLVDSIVFSKNFYELISNDITKLKTNTKETYNKVLFLIDKDEFLIKNTEILRNEIIDFILESKPEKFIFDNLNLMKNLK